jgi:hypothetical protein
VSCGSRPYEDFGMRLVGSGSLAIPGIDKRTTWFEIVIPEGSY